MDDGRLLEVLDSVVSRLTNIESKLSELDEKSKHLYDSLNSINISYRGLTERLRSMELWVAEHGDTTSIKEQIYSDKDSIIVLKQDVAALKDLKRTVVSLKASNSNNEGKRVVMFSVVKWAGALLIALAVWVVSKFE